MLDPITGPPRQVLGGLVFAGVNGAKTTQGNQPAIKAAPRVGAVFSINDKTVLRGGWGLYFVPCSYPAAGTTGWGQIGYSATTNLQQTTGVPTTTMTNPFPGGLVQPSGNSLGLSLARAATSRSSIRTRALRRCSMLPRTCSTSFPRRDGERWLHRLDRAEPQLGRQHQHQFSSIPKYLASGVNTNGTNVTNPFYGIADAGPYSQLKTIQLGQLLRPFPEFGNVNMSQATGAKSQYNVFIATIRNARRACGAVASATPTAG